MVVVTRGNGAIVLVLVEEAFDEVATLEGARAERGRIEPMVEWTDIGYRALGSDFDMERVAVVAAIGQQDASARQRPEHVLGAFAVAQWNSGLW